ncbi:hypothetical protein ACFLZI_01930 [Nitrospirota bacterium]
MKKGFLILMAMMLAIGLIAGCGGSSSSDGVTPPAGGGSAAGTYNYDSGAGTMTLTFSSAPAEWGINPGDAMNMTSVTVDATQLIFTGDEGVETWTRESGTTGITGSFSKVESDAGGSWTITLTFNADGSFTAVESDHS